MSSRFFRKKTYNLQITCLTSITEHLTELYSLSLTYIYIENWTLMQLKVVIF